MNELNLLIAQAKEGKQLAFTKLYNKYYNTIRYVIYNIIRNIDVTDDLISVTFTKAFMKIDKYVDNISFEMWLKTIAVNSAIDFIRRSRQEKLNDSVDDETSLYEFVDTMFSNPEDNFIFKQEKKILGKLIPTLRYKDQELLRLRFVEEKSYREIASSLKIQEEAVKSQLAKAKQRLKLKFNKYNKQKLTESSNHEHFNSTSVNSSSNSDNLKDFQIDDSVS